MSLTESIKAGDLVGVRRALEVGEATVEGAPSPILLAVYYGRYEAAERLREHQGRLDVFEAAAMGDLHQLERILAGDAKAHAAVSADGFTPLGYAAYFGHLEALNLLLRKGANPNIPSENPLKVTPLHSALAGGRKEMARLLVDAGADVDALSGNGWSPLHYCAENGDIETSEYLLDHGARGDEANAEGQYPADLAEAKGFADLAEKLRPKGA